MKETLPENLKKYFRDCVYFFRDDTDSLFPTDTTNKSETDTDFLPFQTFRQLS